MATTSKQQTEAPAERQRAQSPYEKWIASTGVPVHRGYFVEDVRTLELGPWPERECDAAFLALTGQEGISEARVTEIGPAKTLPPLRYALDEITYVVEGRGMTTVWPGENGPKKTFEWEKHSMFMVPRGFNYQLTNSSGTTPVRLLHYNYMPIAMNIVPDPKFFFESDYVNPEVLAEGDLYSEATAVSRNDPRGADRVWWYGRFFPDMRAWDKLHTYQERGAGGHRVGVVFSGSTMWSHMSVFPVGTYKKAHRHGPGVVIIIPAGEGYSIMWPEGGERVVIPWHEASVFVPPSRWFHQHFNVGGEPARYLAFHAVRGAGQSEQVRNLAADQIEYPDEERFVREKFEAELAKRDLKTLMPEQAYTDPNYEFGYEMAGD